MISVFEKFDSILLLLASLLAFVSCSRPRDKSFKIWIKNLRKEFSGIRRADDHIRAAVVLRLFDRKIQKSVKSFITLSLSRVKALGVEGTKAEVISFLIMFGPFTYLMVAGDNYGSSVFTFSTFWFVSFLFYMVLFFHVMKSGPPFVKAEDTGIYYSELKGRTKIGSLILLPVSLLFGLRYRFLMLDGDRIAVCVRYVEKHMFLAFVLSSLTIFILIHKLFYNYLDLPSLVFYPLTLTLGPIFFLFVAILVFFAFSLPTISGNSTLDFKKYSKGAIYLSFTTTVTLILYYSAKFETPNQFDTSSVWLVYVNILCDIYVIILFNKLARLIAITRKSSNIYSLVVLREYFLFFVRSLIASAISMYVGFYFSSTPLTVFGASKLLVGLNPYGDGPYFGIVFWLVHTAVFPVVAILTIPIMLIAIRAWKVFVLRIVVGAIRNGSPAAYLSSSLFFIVAVTQSIFDVF